MGDKTAFVTGATGFLGLNLVEVLLEGGWHVTALHRPSSDCSRLQGLNVELVEGDILDRDSLKAAIPPGVDAVFHVAADTSMWSRAAARQERINVDGTRNVIAAAIERRAGRMIHTSTIAVYGFQDGIITEESPR
ncbi:MAG TPA: NAD-dependent epimerase/dehydratase family protein, partial [Planctomycetaceae bacterium]|nr:NAD-dependent epimerase/dehydratase family protein [Planctomycetaceae bacterium]